MFPQLRSWVLVFLLSLVSLVSAAIREGCEVTWTATIEAGSHGTGVVSGPGEAPRDWAEPNLPGSFGLGLDTHNPKTENIFNADGNIYDRPQREVSLHLDGREIANMLCPVELVGTRRYRLVLRSVVGGSEVGLWIDRKAVFENRFVPRLKPTEDGWRFGPGIADGRFKCSGRKLQTEPVQAVQVFKDELNDATRHRFEKEVDLPRTTEGVGRVLATLTLGPTPKGLDPWDRIAAIYVTDEQGERFEILRCMTPYRKGWSWTVDLTDYLPLLAGKRKFSFECETWGEGWLVSLKLDYVKGPLARVPIRVRKVWAGVPVIGQASKPVQDFFAPRVLTLDRATRSAKVRMSVTGHGMSPNTDNAAEFLPLWRELRVNGQAYRNVLWKEDNYLNPCRPQGGTWKFDRAGWAPGDVVTPWVVDVSRHAWGKKEMRLEYEIQPYENKTPVEGNPARYVVEVHLIETK